MPRSLFVALPLFAAGCDDTIFGTGGGATTTATGYAGVLALTDENCMTCHSAAAADVVGNGLNLETDFYAATVNVASTYPGYVLVVPSDTQSSLLYLKLTATNPSGTGTVMPQTGMLPAESIAVYEDWIVAGAPEE